MLFFFDQKYFRIGLILLFCSIGQLSFSQLQVLADRPNANYEAGETMYFEVSVDVWGPVDYDIFYDNKMPVLASGRIYVSPGSPAKIPFTLEEAGSINCRVKADGNTAIAGAVFSRNDLEAYDDEPADFDAFWDGVKAELATVPIDPVLTFLDSTSYSETYRINLGNIDNRRVYGYISIPKGIAPPYPAILSLPPFGTVPNIVVNPNVISEFGGALSMAISIHNVEPDEEDPNSYIPNVITDAETIYYKQGITGAIRAIDYIFSRSDFNGEDLGLMGLSQGGGLALLTAGIDPRVKTLVQSVPALCSHAGHRYNRPSGLPLYIFDSRGSTGTIEHEDLTLAASKYFDGIYFAKRFKGPSLTFVSYADTISPLEPVLAALNQLEENNIVGHNIRLGHENPPEFWDMRFDFWRKNVPAMNNSPVFWAPTTTGYDANAGNDMTINLGGTANLTATVSLHGDPLPNQSAQWTIIKGPGKVSFSNPTAYNTTATFSVSGEYLIRFVATAEPTLLTEGKFYTLSDFVTVTVN